MLDQIYIVSGGTIFINEDILTTVNHCSLLNNAELNNDVMSFAMNSSIWPLDTAYRIRYMTGYLVFDF